MTSYGVKCRFPVAEIDNGYALAVLLCTTFEGHVGLLLHPSNSSLQDPTRKKYHVGYAYLRVDDAPGLVRLSPLGSDIHNLRFNGKQVKAKWQDIYIAEGPPPNHKDDGINLCYPLNCI